MDTSIYLPYLKQLSSSPAFTLVVLGISVIGYLLEIWPNFNSKFVPIVCILLGPVSYPFFCSAASVPKDYPHPIAVFIVNGLVAGLIASIVHAALVRFVLSRFAAPTDDDKKDPKV